MFRTTSGSDKNESQALGLSKATLSLEMWWFYDQKRYSDGCPGYRKLKKINYGNWLIENWL